MGCEGCISRRRFLELSTKSVLVMAIAGCSQQPLSSPLGTGPSSTNVPNNQSNIYTFGFTDFPALQSAGGSIHVTIQATSGSKDVYITRVDANTVDTVSTICTHAGCTINAYDPSTAEYLCPCHASVFAADGAVITGPAVNPLPSYSSALTATGVNVTVP
jgi:Rieske Fe-S protein